MRQGDGGAVLPEGRWGRDEASGVRFTDDETGDAEVMPILPEPAEPLFFRLGSGWIPVKGLLSGNVADCTGNGG